MEKFNGLKKSLIFVVILFSSLTTFPSWAQSNQWAVKMFSELGTERTHNFGSVALHANVEHRFQFKNIYKEDVVIASISSNCGCTKASASKTTIRSGETAEIIARVDTSGREHTKKRKATIRVIFSAPTQAEVQLQVNTYIRPDVGFEPGLIEFGTVEGGASVVKKAYLQYEGREDWALVGIQKTNQGIRAEAREVRRQNGSVVYEILVELKPDAAPGYINDLLKFQTNDRDLMTASIFLPVQGLVTETLNVKPQFVQFGIVPQKQKVIKNVVISGSTPFKILDVHSQDERVSFQKTDLTRSVHVIPLSFEADASSGEISGEVVIETDQKDKEGRPEKLVVATSGFVVDPQERHTVPKSKQKTNSPVVKNNHQDENGESSSQTTKVEHKQNNLSQTEDLGSTWRPVIDENAKIKQIDVLSEDGWDRVQTVRTKSIQDQKVEKSAMVTIPIEQLAKRKQVKK